MKPKPMPGYVLLRIQPDPKPQSGIILPDRVTSKLNPNVIGIVAAIGAPTHKWTMQEVKRGGVEKVIVQRGIGTRIDIDGHEHRFVHISELIMVIPTKENL